MLPEEKVDRLWDVYQIKNHMGRYAYYHNANQHEKTVELFDLSRDDIWVECGEMGVYKGVEGVKAFFEDWHHSVSWDQKGVFVEHVLTSEVIEVAKDGQTAYAVWISPGAETRRIEPNGELEALWVWGKYGVDFIKDKNGKWKFWHVTITIDFMTDYHRSWIESADENRFVLRTMSGMPQPHSPNTFQYGGGYHKEQIWGMNPKLPVPSE